MSSIGHRLGKFASRVLLFGVAVCLLLFAVMVWRHGMSIRYTVFLLLALVFALGLRMPDTYKINSVLCGMSLAIAVYGVELLLARSRQ